MGRIQLTRSKNIQSQGNDLIISLGDFTLNADGNLIWRSNKRPLSKEFAELIIAEIQAQGKDLKGVMAEDPRSTITVSLNGVDTDGSKRQIAWAIGHAYERYFFQSLILQAAHSSKFKITGPVFSDSNREFIASSQNAVSLIRQVPSIDSNLRAAAKQGAEQYIADLEKQFANIEQINMTVTGVGNNAVEGDFILQLENAMNGKNLSTSPDGKFHIEVKAYSNISNITYASLSDSNFAKDGKLTFSNFLYQKNRRKIFWNKKLDTEHWKNLLQSEGLELYGYHLAGMRGSGSGSKGQAFSFFNYLLGKASHQLSLSNRKIIVAQTTTGKATVTADLDNLLGRLLKEQMRMDFKSQSFNFSNNGKTIGSFNIQSDLARESVTSTLQTPGEGPDWNTQFGFHLSRNFLGI